jgi:long-chain fatty acid transport protein
MKHENNVTERGGNMKKSLSVLVLFLLLMGSASVLMPAAVFATNGMNLEGYGPIATGMGGASMAYDNGSAAVMNNPATLGLMPEGNRLDVALGYLGPHVKASMPGMPEAKSSADAFFMPAIGWVARSGPYAYGVGVFSQGGMGTEYGADSFLASGSGDKVRSELGVGRLIVPFAYKVNDALTLAATVDYVWASLDLKMAAQVGQLGGLVTGGSGPLLSPTTGIPALPVTNWARIDFSGGGAFTGAATGSGLAGKLGAAYKISDAVSIGATYHSKTSLSDLKTSSDGATLSAQGAGSVPGKITVHDFQWPETYAVGVAWNATKELLVVFDIKQINWKDVMKDFKMTFEGGNSTIDFALPQNWKDQTVYELGVGYMVSPEWILRAGINYANNPIPDTYLNALFPAIEETHVTVGAGYMISKVSSIDASFSYAPEVKSTTQVTVFTNPADPTATTQVPVTVTHSQTNAQVMYSYRF